MIIVQLDSDQLSNLIQSSILKVLSENKFKQPTSSEKVDQFLTIKEASELLKLTVPTLYSKVSKGELPVMKRGKRLYFSKNELLNYLREGRKKSNSEIVAEAEHYLINKKAAK